MKKRNLKSLKLNKKSISNLEVLNGGLPPTGALCSEPDCPTLQPCTVISDCLCLPIRPASPASPASPSPSPIRAAN